MSQYLEFLRNILLHRTSVAYSTASKTKGTRLMLVNEVALGNCLDTTQKDLTLTCAPEGYQSVHGVKATFDQPSDFKVITKLMQRISASRVESQLYNFLRW